MKNKSKLKIPVWIRVDQHGYSHISVAKGNRKPPLLCETDLDYDFDDIFRGLKKTTKFYLVEA